MKKLTYTGRYGKGTKMLLNFARYSNGRTALQLLDEQYIPQFTCTTNLPEEDCPEGQVWIKDWSENAGMQECLINEGIISRHAEAIAHSGHVTATRHRLLISPE